MLDRLVTEKLTAEAETIAKEGWKWISVAVDFPYGHTSQLRELEGKPADLTTEEQAAIDGLKAEQAKLDPTQAPGLRDSVPAKAVEARHESWKARLPKDEKDLWDALTALDGTAQASLFAHCASFAVNALYEPANRYNEGRVSAHGIRARLDQADVLARAVGLDMVQAGWKPTVDNYLGRVTKPRILEAVREAKGERSAQLIDHLKKGDMARWRPSPFSTAPVGCRSRCAWSTLHQRRPSWRGKPDRCLNSSLIAVALVNERSGRAAIQVPAPSLMLDDGEIERRVRLIRPMEHNSLPLKMMTESHWAEADRERFAAAWQAELAEVPEFTDSPIHMAAGLLLPIWKRLPNETRVYRLQTDAGERIIGRKVSPAWVAATLAGDAPADEEREAAADEDRPQQLDAAE